MIDARMYLSARGLQASGRVHLYKDGVTAAWLHVTPTREYSNNGITLSLDSEGLRELAAACLELAALQERLDGEVRGEHDGALLGDVVNHYTEARLLPEDRAAHRPSLRRPDAGADGAA